jgi:FKBP-type peptidyl-prolyl cis-trans isomerase SlyD
VSTQVICFKCVLRDKYGNLISSSVNRNVLTSLPGEVGLLSGLAKGLQDLSKGEKRSIALSAEQAYGFYDTKKVILFPRKKISNPSHLRVGQMVSVVGKSGEVRSYKVLQLHGEMISLDGNHPLAGQDLVFEIEALDARAATTDEIFEAQNLVAAQLLH